MRLNEVKIDRNPLVNYESIFDRLYCRLYLYIIQLRYKSLINYLEIFYQGEEMKSIALAKAKLENNFNEDALTITRFELSKLNSLFYDYYLDLSSHGKISKKAKIKWILKTIDSDIKKETSSYYRYQLLWRFRNDLGKTIEYLYLISNYPTDKNIPDFIKKSEKWGSIIQNLREDNVIDEENRWQGLGEGFSKHPTQLAVFIKILIDEDCFNLKRDKEIVSECGKMFKVELGHVRFCQVKNDLSNKGEICKYSSFYEIYARLYRYL